MRFIFDRRPPDPPAGSAVPLDPILRSKNKKSVRQKTFPANKSSLLLPKNSSKTTSHCNCAIISSRAAVRVSALSPKTTASAIAPAGRRASQGQRKRRAKRCSWRSKCNARERLSGCASEQGVSNADGLTHHSLDRVLINAQIAVPLSVVQKTAFTIVVE